MAVLNIKWESEEEKNRIKSHCLEGIEKLVISVVRFLWNPKGLDITGLRSLTADTRVAIRAYKFLFHEDLDYEIFPTRCIFFNLTTHTVIRTFTRKEVINND